ncbi:DUF6919 domain-containing protein [Streptomyces olivaceus]|uniref:DUF6919 domain-containing protein n=1 Tax=Streptomyces olivaceus TaxID=47716 RepID=UPI003716DC33
MTRATSRAWAAARTTADLGALTAQWLEGKLDALPGGSHRGGPDPETAPLVDVLAAVNRAGWVTIQSQPGCDGPAFDGRRWRQRAAVMLLVDPVGRDRLTAAARTVGLLVAEHRAERPGLVREIPVTTWDGGVHTAFGVHFRRRHLRQWFSGCHREALRAVGEAHQVTLADPRWNEDGLLWPLLAAQAAVVS